MWLNILIRLLIKLAFYLLQQHSQGKKLHPRELERIQTALGHMKNVTGLASDKFGLTPATVELPQDSSEYED